jgi:hypothetical protein
MRMMMMMMIIIIIIIIPVTEHEDIPVLWNQGIQTDREVLANRPDIIVKTRMTKPAY